MIMEIENGVYISTYGCQMNVNDTERMYCLLEMNNFIPVSDPDLAEVIIINSCSVREKPVHKVYSEVGRYRKKKLENPRVKIGVGGCVGQQERNHLLEVAPLVDFVFGPDNIDHLPELIEKTYSSKKPVVSARLENKKPYHVETLIRHPGVSTFVNIAKGCDNFCSFCIVPFTRGRERSRPMSHLVKDLNNLVKRGAKEVTLLGQNVNSYRSDCGADFADLLECLATETDVERIRFITSHPKDFNEKLSHVMQRCHNKVCEYIHLPFQSGSNEILKRMNRGYTREEYFQKIQMIRDVFPQAVFSADVIVGFPGETEEDFELTMDLMEKVGFETLFAFKYSPRPFTKAAQFEDQISEEIKSRRLNSLFDRHNVWARQMAQNYIGTIQEILVENFDIKMEKVSGRSRSNKLVFFQGQGSDVGKTISVKIIEAQPNTLQGVKICD